MIVISEENIHQYRSRTDTVTTKIWWMTGQLDARVLCNFPNLAKLDCSSKQLVSLVGIECCSKLRRLKCNFSRLVSLIGIEHCQQLVWLECSNNQLASLEGIEHCQQLEWLDCSNNQLASLEGIESCPQLQELDCSNNLIVSLAGLDQCLRLSKLHCYNNNLTSLASLKHCSLLYELECSGNQLASIAGIESCTKLRKLDCSVNQLVSLKGVECCSQLEFLYFCHNQIASLEQIVYLRYLHDFDHEGNPLGVQSIQVQRFFDRRDRCDRRSVGKSIYSDAQNIHDVHIQKTVCDSVQRLLCDSKPKFSIDTVIDSSLGQHTIELLVEYCGDETVHSVHLLTYQELLGYVWNRIIQSEHRDELFRILEEQIGDSECKCFTGRFNRTLSVLVGFYEDIVISISNSSRISAIILALKDRTRPYDAKAHREAAHGQLLEAGYTEADIEPWLEAIE